MRQDIKEILDQVTIEHIIDIMTELGSLYPIKSSDGRSYIFSSVCHGDLSKQKLYCFLNDDGISFYCFVCSEHYSSIIDLLMQVNVWDFPTTMNYIKEKCGISSSYRMVKRSFGNDDPIDDWELFAKYRTKKKVDYSLPSFDSRVLDLFPKLYYQGWIDEGICEEAMQDFGIGYYFRDNAITIPHHDINGRLVGIRKRNLNQDEVDRGWKYMPLVVQGKMYNHQLNFNLYGLHKTKETIKKIKKVVIFEAEKSVLMAQSYYKDNNFTCACCGSNISIAQRQLLLSLGAEEITICFDRDFEEIGDAKYKLFEKKVMNIAKLFCPYMKVSIVCDGMIDLLGLKQSPIDRGKEVFEELLKRKEYITLEE